MYIVGFYIVTLTTLQQKQKCNFNLVRPILEYAAKVWVPYHHNTGA